MTAAGSQELPDWEATRLPPPPPPQLLPPPSSGWSGWAPPPGALNPDGTLRPSPARRWLGWPAQQPDAQQAAARLRDRRPHGVEILIVLGVFPAAAVLSAVMSLLTDTLGGGSQDDTGYVGFTLPGHDWLAALLDVPLSLMDLVAAALAAYLLYLSGGGLAALGLDRRRVRADLAVTGKLFSLAYVLPFFVGSMILSGLGSDGGEGVSNPPQLVYLIPLAVGALMAGIVEEIVVLGYLVHRLEQRGWASWAVVATATAVRVSFHLYYGIGVLPFIGWAALSVVLYRQRRRLLPFIVLHCLWDLSGFVSQYLPSGGVSALPYVLLAVTLFLLRVTAPRQASTAPTVEGWTESPLAA